jgi:predicted lipid-binding transport protein (Tim44 family)
MYIYQTMSNNFGFIDIILLAMIAGFIILRLRNILGRKTGHEGKVSGVFEEKKFEKFKPQVKSKPVSDKGPEGEERKEFLQGAELAYEAIILAFAKGEKEKLKNLLTKEMNDNFDEAINQRKVEGIKSDLTFIGFKDCKLERFEKINNNYLATVKFVSEIISVKKDKENKIIDGDPDKIKMVTDHWKFSKNIHSKNPNWALYEIISK